MEITIGKFMYQSIDDEVLTIMKKDKEVYRMNIREIEITFYQPEATFSRVPGVYFVAPGMNSAYLCTNRKDKGEIRRLHDYLVQYGAKEIIMGAMKAGMAQHSSDIQKKQEEKALLKQQKEEEKKQLKLERGKQAAIRLEKQRRRSGCKEKTEEKYRCTVCGAIWYSNSMDRAKNVHNALSMSTYAINQMRDISRCPKCGSGASKHHTVRDWIDKKGNCMDREE